MKISNVLLIGLLFWTTNILVTPSTRLGFCRVPVADLLGQSMSSIFNDDATVEHYKHISTSPRHHSKQNAIFACQRIHQLLLHEVVEIVDETDQEVCIRLYHVFYSNEQDAHNNTFWTLKEYIENLAPTDHDKVAMVPSFRSETTPGTVHCLTLILPFFDTITQIQYSAGTRFALMPEQPYDKSTHKVYSFNAHNNTFVETHIPADLCISTPANFSPHQKRALFLHIARQWASLYQGYIPFVWGGCSFIQPYRPEDFTEKIFETPHHEEVSAFYRVGDIQAGFDASNLVLRIAQICSLPYFYKNTTTAYAHLHAIDSIDDVESGDILWVPGGMAIVDKEHNTLISARGYSAGYGIVNELPIQTLFKGLETFADIFDALAAHRSLEYCDKAGNIITRYNTAQFFKLPL